MFDGWLTKPLNNDALIALLSQADKVDSSLDRPAPLPSDFISIAGLDSQFLFQQMGMPLRARRFLIVFTRNRIR